MNTILVVDDSAVDRQLLVGLISKDERFDVITAETAAKALNRLAEWGVDLVVTDLQMPGMDGLELVKWIREQHPDVPTILATGQGSEETAAQALRAGAAGYVPKTMLAEQLLPTILDAINIMSAERSYRNLIDQAKRTTFLFELDNNPENIPPLIDLCEKMLAGLSELDAIEQLRIGVAIEQALHNALYRGNLEISSSYSIPFGDEEPTEEVQSIINERLADTEYSSRVTTVELIVTDIEVICTIGDQGPGFDVDNLHPSVNRSGRGLVLMTSFMDEVEFNEKGNQVRLVRQWGEAPDERAELEVAAEPASVNHSTDDQTVSDVNASALVPESSSDEFEIRGGAVLEEVAPVAESQVAPSATVAPEPPAKESQPANAPHPSLSDSAALRLGLGVLISRDTDERIPLTGRKQLIGRRNTCHITVPFHEVSSHHCQLMLVDGWWIVKDLNSSNGTRINGKRIDQGRLVPGDIIGLGKHELEIQYSPTELGAVGFTPPPGVR